LLSFFIFHDFNYYLFTMIDPLLSLVNRPVLGTTLQGWVNAYKEGGWLPKWASPGYRGSMLGTSADIVISDAIVKDIKGFDVKTAFEAVLQDAFEPPPADRPDMGRACLSAYLEYGYIPRGAKQDSSSAGAECTEVVSRSQSYFQSDFAISKAAAKLGYHSISADLADRARNYTALFEPKTSFMRSRDISSGRFTEPFDRYAWGGDYMESGPWQYRFSVPYDAIGLGALYEGVGRDLCEALEEMQTTAPVFHIGTFDGLIKEQTEMVEQCWGQYAHNDQPVHHVLYMFGAVDKEGFRGACAGRGQYWLRKAMRSFYNPGMNMFAGDEDNGENGAWYVLSAMGLYALSPGTDQYALGSPLFERVEVQLDDAVGGGHTSSKTLVIEVRDNSADNVYVQGVWLNGQELQKGASSVSYFSLMEGGTLTFQMGSEPVTGYE
jgi:predicted alpha-1,2-mannosidase